MRAFMQIRKNIKCHENVSSSSVYRVLFPTVRYQLKADLYVFEFGHFAKKSEEMTILRAYTWMLSPRSMKDIAFLCNSHVIPDVFC